MHIPQSALTYARVVDVAIWVHSALHSLTETGLLLESDRQLPSVTAIVAGGPIRGSWWGNPAARGAYQVLVALEDHPDALRTKLINGKVTTGPRGSPPITPTRRPIACPSRRSSSTP